MSTIEAEAKTKWCPHVRYLAVFRGADGSRETAGCFNRGYEDTGLNNSLCIGSACMMWRLAGPAVYERVLPVSDAMPSGSGWTRGPRVDGGYRWQSDTPVERKGYCGLAGRPE